MNSQNRKTVKLLAAVIGGSAVVTMGALSMAIHQQQAAPGGVAARVLTMRCDDDRVGHTGDSRGDVDGRAHHQGLRTAAAEEKAAGVAAPSHRPTFHLRPLRLPNRPEGSLVTLLHCSARHRNGVVRGEIEAVQIGVGRGWCCAVIAMGALGLAFSDIGAAQPEPPPPGPVTTSEMTTGESVTGDRSDRRAGDVSCRTTYHYAAVDDNDSSPLDE